MNLFIFSNGGNQLDFLNNINYFSFYNHSIVSFITNVASIHLSQYDDISIDDYYATMIQILLNCSLIIYVFFVICCGKHAYVCVSAFCGDSRLLPLLN